MRSMGSMNRQRARSLSLCGAVVAAAAGCGSSGYYYYDPYAYSYGYDYYYPADIAYANTYYADDMYSASGYVFASLERTMISATPGSTLRALASGESVCPGQVSVMTEPNSAPCSVGNEASLPAHTLIVFEDCEFSEQGKLDGALQIDASQTASDAECDADTVLDVHYSSMATDLSYTTPSGARVVLRRLTLTGDYARHLDALPAEVAVSVEGNLERYDEIGAMVLQATFSGSQSLVPLDAGQGYRLDGTLVMQDDADGQSVTVSSEGLTRTDACCHPTSGTLQVERAKDDSDRWTFGPGCGELARDGESARVRDCY
jgi:hypothetical protein